MEAAKLVLEFLKALAWPLLVLLVLIRYHRSVQQLLTRFSTEAEEIEAKVLGISVKLRKQISSTSAGAEKASQTSNDAKIAEALARQQAQILAAVFLSEPLSRRQEAAREVEALSRYLSLDTILELVKSSDGGERVVGGISLRQRIQEEQSLSNDERVVAAVGSGLRDPASRVRYRFVRAVGRSQALRERFKQPLQELADADENETVRQEAKRVLRA